jgi:hypothetical protein
MPSTKKMRFCAVITPHGHPAGVGFYAPDELELFRKILKDLFSFTLF